MKMNKTRQILRISHNGPGIQVNGQIGSGGSQPPKKSTLAIALMRIMLAYSPRKKRAKVIELYSTL